MVQIFQCLLESTVLGGEQISKPGTSDGIFGQANCLICCEYKLSWIFVEGEPTTTVESNLETKLTQLDINVKKTNVFIESQNSEAYWATSTNFKGDLGHCESFETWGRSDENWMESRHRADHQIHLFTRVGHPTG